MALYHKEIGLPEKNLAQLDKKHFNFEFSRHALQSCLNDRYGQIVPPQGITVQAEQIIELEIDGVKTLKVVTRIPYVKNPKFDLLIAFIPDGESAFVKTCWLNDRTDTHKTLVNKNWPRLLNKV